MTGYRLTFGVQHLRSTDIADSMVAVSDVIGEVVSALPEGVEMIGHNYLIGLLASQVIVRFEADDDDAAYDAARGALRSVTLPIDGEKIERRSRRYIPIGA
jgi:hypothetical protein